MKAIFREPLLHFLIIGALLFVLYGYVGDDSEPDNASIVVGKARIERIQTAWEKQWRRLPTEDELEKLVEQFVQEEVLYREALAMGLEKDDTIVRRRLAQKTRFLIQDIADQNQPEEADLKAFFEEGRDLYKTPARMSFTHVYFNSDRRGAAAIEDARQVLGGLNTADVDRAPDRGDPFMLHYDYVEVSQQEAMRLFGTRFADELFALRPGSWQGPIRSGYGIHLVRISEYVPERMPEFSEVVERVRQEYLDRQRRKANEDAIKSLKARYKIEIDVEAMKREGAQTTSLESSGDAS